MSQEKTHAVGANAGRSRLHNRQVVLGHIRAAGTAGRAEVARLSGLSIQAVSNIIAELESDGLIRSAGRRTAGRGQPAVQYSLNPAGGFALGVEVRPDALFVAILELDGSEVFSASSRLPKADPATVTQQTVTLRDRGIIQAGIPAGRLLGAGIVMPGPIGVTRVSDAGTESVDWQGIDVRKCFADALEIPVLVENDANAAAVAERVSGVARGLDTYAFVYFGTGLGLGIVSHGRLEKGAFGNAGEIGYIPVAAGGRVVALEDAVSRLSVRRHMSGHGIDVQTADDLEWLYTERHPALMDWLDSAAPPLSQAVHIVENLFDPETVILGGAMPDGMLDHLVRTADLSDRSVSHRRSRAVPRLMRGASGRMAATLGGAALVINRTFTPQIAHAAE